MARIKKGGFITGESNTSIAVKKLFGWTLMDNVIEVSNLACLSNTPQEDDNKLH